MMLRWGMIKHYRVDKMQHTEILETERKGETPFRIFDLASFAKKTFWHVWRCRCRGYAGMQE